MMQALALVQGDSDELFMAIERGNPFAAELRQRFFAEIEGPEGQARSRLETSPRRARPSVEFASSMVRHGEQVHQNKVETLTVSGR